jgi:hypothetical protein
MPPVTAAEGEIYEVVLLSKIQEQDHNNVFHFAAASASDDVQLRLLKALVDCFLLNMMPGLTNQFRCVGAVGRRVSPTFGNAVEYFHTNTSIANVGLVTTDGLPSFNAALISIHTSLPGKSGRGRFSLGGIPEGSTTNSMLNPEAIFWTSLLAFIACLVEKFIVGDPIPANAWQMGVLSRKGHVKGTPFTPDKFAAMTNLIPHQLISHIASRKVGRGS